MDKVEESVLSDTEDPELEADQDKDLDPEKTVKINLTGRQFSSSW